MSYFWSEIPPYLPYKINLCHFLMPRIFGLRIVHFFHFHCTHIEWKYHIKCVAKQSSLHSHTKTILSIWRQNWIYHVTVASRGLGDVRFREIKWMPSALPYFTDNARWLCISDKYQDKYHKSFHGRRYFTKKE